MCEKDAERNMDFAFPFAHFPEWWNVHTHRCNHYGRIPSHQRNYGLGRTMFADWGRVGSVRNFADKSGIQTTPQISDRLKGILHPVKVPTPLFAADYSSKPSQDKEWCSAQPVASPDEASEMVDNLTAYDFGFGRMLQDPIVKEQASAAFICGKVLGLIRANCGLLHEKKNKSVDALECLTELERLATEGIDCLTDDEQCRLLEKINKEITQISTDEQDANVAPSPSADDDLLISHESKPKRFRKPTKPPKSAPSSLLPITFRRMFNHDSVNDTSHRLLAAFDPFIIRVAGRTVNPLYLGHGLLHTFREHLIWALPEGLNPSNPPRLWFSPNYHSSESKPLSINLPVDSVAGTHCCELDVPSSNIQSGFSVVTRWHSYTNCNDNVVFLHFGLSGDLTLPQLNSFTKPKLPGLSSGVCFNPFLSTECAFAGSYSTNLGETQAFVQVHSTDANCAVWSGRVKLDDETDGFIASHRQIMHAAGFSDLSDSVQTHLQSYLNMLSPRMSRFIHRSATSCFLTDYGLRVGFGCHPSQLGLYTANRMLLLDTRQTALYQTLFSLRTPESSKAFNAAEFFTYNASAFIGDVYALASTQYSMIVVDKRMPGRCVLHWSHNLPGAPVHVDWREPNHHLQHSKGLPHILMSAASQFPADVNLVGLDALPHSGPQLIGPSFMAFRPASMMHHDQYCLPSRLLYAGPRLHASICGLASLPPSDDLVSVLSLNSQGDIFRHCWTYSEARADEQYEAYCERNGEWLSDLTLSVSKQLVPTDHAGHLDVTEACRLSPTPLPTEASRDSVDTLQYWEPENIRPTDAFTGKVMHCSKQLLMDLRSMWMDIDGPISGTKEGGARMNRFTSFRHERAKEERIRRVELDALTIAAKARLKRLKSIVDHMLQEHLF